MNLSQFLDADGAHRFATRGPVGRPDARVQVREYYAHTCSHEVIYDGVMNADLVDALRERKLPVDVG